jgi:RNA-binding protein
VLSGKQRRHLRGLGHSLKDVVHVGKEGVSASLVGAVEAALETHELIKIRLLETAGDDRHAMAEEMAKASKSELVQVLGRKVLLYRARKKDPVIKLPR